jgi:hypothetical protein
MRAVRRRPDEIGSEEGKLPVGKINLERSRSVRLGGLTLGLGRRLVQEQIAMARFNGRARACEVDRRADNRACEVGPAHDFSPSCSSRRAAGGRCNVANLDRDGQLGPSPASLSEQAILT